MQQPASQYFHYVRGGTLEFDVYKSWSVRGSYIERPPFLSSGYLDQDFLASVQTGSQFLSSGMFGVYGYAGIGRCWGYLKEVEPGPGYDHARRSDYSLNALALSMEGSMNLGRVDFRAGHSQLVGRMKSDRDETKVAWPFTTYYVSLATTLISGSRR
jgi:hypothetical protein